MRAVDLHDDVADLARAAAPDPRLAAEHDPAADAGAPEDAEHRAVAAARAERGLGVGRHLDVVAERDRRAEALAQLLGERVAARPAGQVLRAGHRAGRGVDGARRADADVAERGGLAARRGGGLAHARPRSPRRRRPGRPSSASGGAPARARRGRRRRRRPGSSFPRGRLRRACAPRAYGSAAEDGPEQVALERLRARHEARRRRSRCARACSPARGRGRRRRSCRAAGARRAC